MNWNAKWIQPPAPTGDICPEFVRCFSAEKQVKSAELQVTAMGVYRVSINEKPVTDAVLMPGWTAYQKRLQYQRYDVTGLLQENNEIRIAVGKGWYRSPMPGWISDDKRKEKQKIPAGLLAQLTIQYDDGTQKTVSTGSDWSVFSGMIRFSEIYDGETADATAPQNELGYAKEFDGPTNTLIEQQGEMIREHEHVSPVKIFQTPAGETVVDFGQEVTGYVSLSLEAQSGDVVELSHGEMLDRDGNFYNGNYRSAKAKLRYICRQGKQDYRPWFTFFGFRYVRIDKFPGQPKPENFTAIAVYSDLRRTGSVRCSNFMLNRLFENVSWGQKGNYLDIPTDCPQRDERLGWTGDAQAFMKTACYQFDVERFFTKWLADMAAEQLPNGAIPHVIPATSIDTGSSSGSAAWDDAVTICPWQIYLSYGNREILRSQFHCMKRYIGFITDTTKDRFLWTGGTHYGDWLGLDSAPGSYKGASREDFIASAFYAYSTSLVIKAGEVLGEDVTEYRELYQNIIRTFRQVFPDYRTQTELVLAAHFGLAEDRQKTADQLAEKVRQDGCKLQTGFVGTPYLLHVLSDYGHADLAYKLLLRTEYPSWLYPVTKGATTVWEHWDGVMQDGSFWSADMNSFNHYAYGSVLDWVYEKAAGIRTVEEYPGFERVCIAPLPDARLEWLEATLQTRHGEVRSFWSCQDGVVRYEITVPVPAHIILNGVHRDVAPGSYIFFTDEPEK